MIKHHIGIDCGEKTGVAVYSTELKKLIMVATTDFFEAIDLVKDNFEQGSSVVWVEDPNKNKPVFERKGAKGKKVSQKIAQDVGGVKRETSLMIRGLEKEGYTVKRVRPQSAKWNAEYLEKITGWTKRNSQHARDAVKLVYGR